MLVLSRKLGEKVRIDGDIEICVVSIHGDKVRLGFNAPPNVRVDREEVWQAIVAAGAHWRYAHLFTGQDYLGPVKCSTKRQAEDARQTHTAAHASNWGLVTDSEERPIVDKRTVTG